MAVRITPGQQHEATMARELSAAFELPGVNSKPAALAGDKGYYGKSLIHSLCARGIKPIIPNHMRKTQAKTFPREQYRRRNVVERTIGMLKHCRRIATRYEKLALSYLAMLKLGIIALLLRKIDIS